MEWLNEIYKNDTILLSIKKFLEVPSRLKKLLVIK